MQCLLRIGFQVIVYQVVHKHRSTVYQFVCNKTKKYTFSIYEKRSIYYRNVAQLCDNYCTTYNKLVPTVSDLSENETSQLCSLVHDHSSNYIEFSRKVTSVFWFVLLFKWRTITEALPNLKNLDEANCKSVLPSRGKEFRSNFIFSPFSIKNNLRDKEINNALVLWKGTINIRDALVAESIF